MLLSFIWRKKLLPKLRTYNTYYINRPCQISCREVSWSTYIFKWNTFLLLHSDKHVIVPSGFKVSLTSFFTNIWYHIIICSWVAITEYRNILLQIVLNVWLNTFREWVNATWGNLIVELFFSDHLFMFSYRSTSKYSASCRFYLI